MSRPLIISDPAFKGGKDGATGPRGEKGESIVGPPGLNFRGRWKARHIYRQNDVVSHEGSSYVCSQTECSREPGGMSNQWAMLAEKGERGPIGPTGATGQRGRSSIALQNETLQRVEALEENGGGASVTAEAVFNSNTLAGQVVYISGDGHVDLAQADNVDTATAVGIATADVLAGETGEYITTGPVNIETWNLTPATVYYLSPDTPGEMTTVYPSASGQFVVILGAAAKPTQLNLEIHWMVEQS